MSDQQPAPSSIVTLFTKRLVQTAGLIAALFVIYTEGATAYLNTQKALEAKAVAGNALLRQKSEGELAEQKARTELEVARNAAERQKAEAAKAEADALKSEAEATTARNTARNAEVKSRAEAATIKAEAELRKQKLIVQVETARNAAQRQAAEADKIEAKAAIKRQANAGIKHDLDVTDCSKPYRPSGNYGDAFMDGMSRRIACGN